MVKRVADLLKLFGEADGFKFLTHDFDPTRNDDFISLVNRCRILLVENTGLIPSHLYDLLFGFLYGKTWEDYNGTEHQFHCSSDEELDSETQAMYKEKYPSLCDHTFFSIECRENEELYARFASYADKTVIVEPSYMREKLHERLTKAAESYKNL